MQTHISSSDSGPDIERINGNGTTAENETSQCEVPEVPRDSCGNRIVVDESGNPVLDENGLPIIKGEIASYYDTMLTAYAEKQWEQSVPNMKDTLGKFLTLDMALIGGTFALIKNGPFPFSVSIAVLILLTSSLSSSLYGLWPFESDVTINCPSEISEWRREVIKRKTRSLIYAALFFFFSVAVAILGVCLKHE